MDARVSSGENHGWIAPKGMCALLARRFGGQVSFRIQAWGNIPTYALAGKIFAAMECPPQRRCTSRAT